MNVRVQVLGSLKVAGTGLDQPRLSKAIRRLIAIIAAAGPDGIGRDELALELWGDPLPESWKSALRNRVTAARKILGPETILNQSGRFCFADTVSVDSWELIQHSPTLLHGGPHEFSFLAGEPFIGIEPSPLVSAHITRVNDARVALMQEVLAAATLLSPLALQSLRSYQRAHALEPSVTRHVVQAHARAGEANVAVKIIDEIRALTPGALRRQHGWVDQLDSLVQSVRPRRRHDDNEPSADLAADTADVKAREALFNAAANDDDWRLALDVAMAGLPEAERIGGDPARLALLEAIPLDKLDANRRFTCCLALTRHLMHVGREEEALAWSHTTRSLADSPQEELLAYITGAVVGDSPDERTPIPLPAAFETAPMASVNLQSLQVAVMSNLERAPFEKAERLKNRYLSLVEASGEPYRRWHQLQLESMSCFVLGDFDGAADIATRAHQYAELFGIADAELALMGQRSNAQWIHPALPGVADYTTEFANSTGSKLSRALQAIARAPFDAGESANEFTRSFNFNSRSFFTFPLVALIASHVTDKTLRDALADRLKKRTGTSAIWGTGSLHLGPVDRVLAQLMDDPVDQEMHMSAAMHVADRQNMPLWRVVCRMDLARAFGNDEHRQQAMQLATTPALREIATSYQGAL